MPDFLCVLLDRSVRGELANVGYVHHSHAGPSLLVIVSGLNISLCSSVGLEVREDEVSVCTVVSVLVEQGIIQRAEQIRIVRGICAVDQLYEHSADVLVLVEDPHGIAARKSDRR